MPLTLVILAAGAGRRYGGAKQFDGVGPGGATLMDYTVFDAIRAGFSRVVFVVRPEDQSAWTSAARARIGRRIDVACAAQPLELSSTGGRAAGARTRPWGTGHAVLSAAAEINGPFAVANADDYYGRTSLERIADFLRASGADEVHTHALVGFALRDTLPASGAVSRAVCDCSPDDQLAALREVAGIELTSAGAQYPGDSGQLLALAGNTVVSMNLWGFGFSIVEHLRSAFDAFIAQHAQSLDRELYLPAVVNDLLATRRARVRVLRTPDRWCGLTHADDRPAVARFLAERVAAGEYPERLWP